MSEHGQRVTALATDACALRSVQIHIDLAAIVQNFTLAKRMSGSRVFAVLKADAYGHGALAVAEALPHADGLAVVTTDEAVALREAGVSQPILVLQGPQQAADCDAYLEHSLWPVIHDLAQHDWFRCLPYVQQLDAWLKVDTGMGRLGVAIDALPSLFNDAAAVRWQGVLSHLACADDPGNAHTQAQINTFRDLALPPSVQRSLANSAAILAWLAHADARDAALVPAMQVTAPLIAVKDHPRGAGIGYAQAYTCSETMRIGHVAVGYADGLPRSLDRTASVLIAGQRCSIVGRVSMDSIAIDLRPAPQSVVGDTVILWGPDHPVERMAKAANTITYELLTGIRGNRTYSSWR